MSRGTTKTCPVCGEKFDDPNTGRGAPRKYCSDVCSKKKVANDRVAAKLTYGPCEIDDCENLSRSRNSPWCHAHYALNRRNGSPTARDSRVRPYKMACWHCEKPVGRRVMFCSTLCMRRDRLNAAVTVMQCVVCEGDIPEEMKLGSMYCNLKCQRVAERAQRYGVDIDVVVKLVSSGVCEICGVETDGHIDHDHVSGQVRGFLCGQCNVGLGMFKDNVDSLARAIEYLENAGERAELGRVESQSDAA